MPSAGLLFRNAGVWGVSSSRLIWVVVNDRPVDLRPPPGADYARQFTASTLGGWSAETPADADEVVIDMSKVQFIDCLGLVAIVAVAEDATNRGLRVKFMAPQHQTVSNYMSRMHLRECLAPFCSEVRLPRVNERNTGHRLYELQRFDADCCDDLAERVCHAMRADGGSERDATAFFKGISEVVGNVAEHSGAGGGWAAMQVMPSSASNGLINFAVADAGHGLEMTLSRRHWIESPIDAMEMAFKRAVSGTGVTGRGNGLDDLRQRVRRHQGRLLAWSGTAAGYSADDAGPIACRETTAAFPGTLIYAGFRPEMREV